MKTSSQIEVPNAAEDRPMLELDLCGMLLSQSVMDTIHGWVQYNRTEGMPWFDLHIYRISSTTFPRLIVDYGDLFELLCKLTKEYGEYREQFESAPKPPMDKL